MHKMGVGCALHFLGKGELHESGLDEIPGVFRTSATADFRNPKEKISRGLPQFCGSPVPFLPLHFSLFTLHSSLPPPLPFVGRYALHAGDQWSAPCGHRLRRRLIGSRLTLGAFAPGVYILLSDSAVLLFLLSKVAQKKKKQKENAVRETRKRGLFIKSPLLTPSKIFTRHMPCFRSVHPTDSENPAAGARKRGIFEKIPL